MKAMLIDSEKNFCWSEVPDPGIGPDEVLIRVGAAALNRADLLQRQGKYPSPPGCPPWMGLEIAGEIVKAGENVGKKSRFRVGDRVCALLGGGGYAQYAAVKFDMLRNRTPAFKAELLAELVKEVWPKLESGAMRPSIYKILPIESAEAAHAILERGENIGKVVLTVP